MPRLADATAYLNTDNSELKRGLDDGEQQVSGWGGRLGSVLQGVGMAVGMGVANLVMGAAQQVGQFMSDSVAAASDLGETISKTNVLFGESANQIVAFAETASTQFGQSKQQALNAASTFATFGKAAGLAGDDLVDFSTGFVGLASDLASFNNTTPEQAIEAIGAALRGESEPLRAYGVLLDDASMRQKALELGIIDNIKNALTPQQKVLAAQALIYEQTSAAQGDFARTSDGLANQQRILAAQMENLKAVLGQALLPVVLAFTSALNQLVTAVLPPLQSFMQDQVIPVMERFGGYISQTLGPVIGGLIGWFQGLGTTMQGQADGPMAYLAAWFEENMPRIQAITERVLGAIAAFWEEHGKAITEVVTSFIAMIVAIWDTWMRNLFDLLAAGLALLNGETDRALSLIAGIFQRNGDLYVDIMQGTVDNIRKLFTDPDWSQLGRFVVEGIARGLLGASWVLYDAVWNTVQDALDAAKNALGIRSPSRVAAEEIGEPFVAGIAEGIRNALGMMSGELGGLGSGLAGVGAGGMGGSVTNNITITVAGGSDATGVGLASRDGVLAGLRAAGLR